MSETSTSTSNPAPVARVGKISATEAARTLSASFEKPLELTREVYIGPWNANAVVRVFTSIEEIKFLGKVGEPYNPDDYEKHGLDALTSQVARANRARMVWGLCYGCAEPTYDFGEACKAMAAPDSSFIVDPLFNAIQELNSICRLELPNDERRDPIFELLRSQTAGGRALQAAARENRLGELLAKPGDEADLFRTYLDNVELLTAVQLHNESGLADKIAEALAPRIARLLAQGGE